MEGELVLTCPEDLKAADVLTVTLPDGSEATVTVPEGVGPGEEFHWVPSRVEDKGEEAVTAAEECAKRVEVELCDLLCAPLNHHA